jgi:hypothetical protein
MLLVCAWWTLNAQTEIQSLTPPSGSGPGQIFALTVADGNGGRDIASVGLYVTARFDGARPSNVRLAYYDRASGEFRLAHDSGNTWQGAAAGARRELANSQCTVDASESRVTMAGDRMTVEFAVRFAAGWKGPRRVYGYASAAGDAGSTGWREVGSWLVGESAPAEATAAAADPNDGPTKQLDKADTDYDKFLRTNAGALEGTHGKGILRLVKANGQKAAIVGAVTHQDATGKWVANTPVLSETKQGWRLDGASNGLIIRKKGLDKHEITQTYTDFTTKHDSTLVLTVPSLVYDKKQIFHFPQDGLTWDLTTDLMGAFNLAAKVAAKRGKATYTFDVSSSEALAVDAKGNLIGDPNVKLSRAMMYPKYGKAVACSAWAYTKKDGASFTCDDSGFKAEQLPYRIDPSSHTYTDGGTYSLYSFHNDWDSGGSSADVDFNTAGLLGNGGSFLSQSCGFSVGDSYLDGSQGVKCDMSAFNNSGNTHLNVHIDSGDQGDNSFSFAANVSNVSLTVNYIEGWSLTVSAPPGDIYAGSNKSADAVVSGLSNWAVTWSISPPGRRNAHCGHVQRRDLHGAGGNRPVLHRGDVNCHQRYGSRQERVDNVLRDS